MRPGGTSELAGRSVARVGFGALPLERATDDTATAVLRRAVELGINHVDTAAFYGPGTANARIRAALRPYPADLVLVSKVGARRSAGAAPLELAQRPEDLRDEVERNLAQLGVDRLDVVNLRRADIGPGLTATAETLVPIEDQLAVMIELRDAGKIGGVGVSGASTDNLRLALDAGIVCVQNAYSVVDRSTEDQFALCREHGIAWVPFFPLGSGFPAAPKVAEQPAVVAAAERLGATPQQVGLAWLLGRAPEVLLIPGTTSVAHLEQNAAAGSLRLDAEATAAIDATHPGRG